MRHFIFVCSGWCKGITESLEVENLLESVPDLRLLYRKIERKKLIRRVLGLFQGHLCLTSSDKVVFEKSMGYQLKRRERRKSVVLKNRYKMFRDNNHQSLYTKIKLYNDIECRESGTSIHEWVILIITLKSPLSAATSRGLKVTKK